MKLEVGKKYKSNCGTIYKIICNENNLFIGFKDTKNVYAFFEDGTPAGYNVFLVEEYVEPVKYSVDIWFDDTPKPKHISNLLDTFIFGEGATWSRCQYNECIRRFRVTVEEVRE
jgi:hypothetical protein